MYKIFNKDIIIDNEIIQSSLKKINTLFIKEDKGAKPKLD